MSTYVTTTTYPAQPTATIYIEGLFGLCFKGQQRCTVGLNKQATHSPVFKFYKWTPSSPPKETDCELLLDLPLDVQRVAIHVKKNGTRKNAVQVYDGNSPSSSPDRYSFVDHCVDIEGPRGHNQRIKNKALSLWPRFYIDDGLFCAYKLSTADFDFKDTSGAVKVPLNKLALAIAADLFLETGESIEITADGRTVKTVTIQAGSFYEIGITNLCGDTELIDFDMHYAVLDVPSLSPYTLASKISGAGSTTRTILGHCINSDSDASDRAPCMAVVFGETEDFVD